MSVDEAASRSSGHKPTTATPQRRQLGMGCVLCIRITQSAQDATTHKWEGQAHKCWVTQSKAPRHAYTHTHTHACIHARTHTHACTPAHPRTKTHLTAPVYPSAMVGAGVAPGPGCWVLQSGCYCCRLLLPILLPQASRRCLLCRGPTVLLLLLNLPAGCLRRQHFRSCS